MAEERLDLRKQAPSAKEVADQQIMSLGGNRLPLQPGEVVWTPPEIEMIQKVCPTWKPGDPVPPDLPDMFEKAQAASKIEQQLDDDIAGLAPVMGADGKVEAVSIEEAERRTKKLQAPALEHIDNLPPERQAELRKAIEDAKVQQDNFNAVERQTVPSEHVSGEGINEAIRAAQQTPVDGPTIIDDLDQKAAAAAPETMSKAPEPAIDPRIEEEEKKQREEWEDEAGHHGGHLGITNCPHCNWDLSLTDGIEITDQDKYAYLAATLGGQPYKREVQLFGGMAKIIFKSLTVEESDLAAAQLNQDAFKGEIEYSMNIPGPALNRMYQYRMIMSLQHVTRPTNVVDCSHNIHEVEYDKEEAQTPLKAYQDWMHEKVLTSESFRNAVLQQYILFQRVVDKMEAHTDQPDFWKGIGPQP
jgi:hypothetical protein